MIFTRILILSFCSMCYQLLIARSLAELTHEYILSYSLCFGVFLLGMGLGGIYYGRSLSHKNPLNIFFTIEMLLAVFGGLAIFLIFSSFTFMNISFFSEKNKYLTKDILPYFFLLITQFFIFFIGFLSGFELPIWLKIKEKKNVRHILSGTGALLGAGYIGGFLGSVMVTLLIVPSFGVLKTCILIGFINIVILMESLISYKQFHIKKGILLFLPMIILYTCGTQDKHLIQLHLKTWYLEAELPRLNIKGIKQFIHFMKPYQDILRVESPYQNIDIVPKHFLKHSRIPHLSLYGKGMAFYLNRQPQFFSNFWRTYHESLAVGGFVLTGKEPENVLILGGGDGLLVSQIMKFHENIKTITLVEIDPTMIHLAKNYEPLAQLNQKAFKNKKVKVIIDDAFTYVAKDRRKYDAIFIDFPFPRSFDLSRLYSIEFYKRVKNLLTTDGFIILDVPIWKYIDNEALNVKPMPQDILYSTLSHAGYHTIFAFGKKEPFLFLQTKKNNINFKNTEIKYKVSKDTKNNLSSIHHIVEDVAIKDEYINSVFKPVRFKY